MASAMQLRSAQHHTQWRLASPRGRTPWRFEGRALTAIITLFLVAAACGSDDEPAPITAAATTAAPTTAAATTAAPTTAAMAEEMGVCEGTTLSFIGLDGEAGETELEAWRAENNVSLETNWPGNWQQFVTAIKVGDVYDLATIAYFQAQRQIAAGLFHPIDTSRLENWDTMFAGLRENVSLRGADGQVYGVPIAWGDGPFIYHPGRVSNPPNRSWSWPGRSGKAASPCSIHLSGSSRCWRSDSDSTTESAKRLM